MLSPEIYEAIDDACESQVASGSGWDRKPKAISVERATDLIRRFAQNAPSEMTLGELSDELCLSNNQGPRE